MADETNFFIDDSILTGIDDFLNDEETTTVLKNPEGKTVSKPSDVKKQEDVKKSKVETTSKEADIFSLIENEDDDNNEEEKDEENNNEEDKNNEIEEEENNDEPVSPFKEITEELLKLGIISLDDEQKIPEVNSGEEFAELFRKEKIKGANEYLNNFLTENGNDRLDLFKAIFIDGVDPRDYIPKYNDVIDFKEWNLELPEIQEKVLDIFYTSQGIPAERVRQKIEKLRNNGDIEEEAKELYPLLLKKQEDELRNAEEQAKTKKSLEQERQDRLKTSVKLELSKTKNILGTSITDSVRNELFNYINTPRYKTKEGELLSEYDKMVKELKSPENVSKLLIAAMLFKSDFNLKDFKTDAISKESNTLFKNLAQKSVKLNKPKSKFF